MRQDKDGNIYYNYGINGIAVSATVSIVLTGGTNQASVTINELLRKYVDHERLFGPLQWKRSISGNNLVRLIERQYKKGVVSKRG